tara:strand:+ start:524 stop:1264 length:741 start_codon:yes stop_codon:yes gene_type:complete
MTTLVGMKVNSGSIDGVVLGSDTQLGEYDKNSVLVGKKRLYKIASGDFWSMGHAGEVTEELRRFYNRLTKPEMFKDYGKIDVEEMINDSLREKRFIEIDKLNANYCKSDDFLEDGELDDLHEFIIAVNKPKLELYRVDCFGNLIPRDKGKSYVVLGEGGAKAEEYIEESLDGERYDSDEITLEGAIRLCRNGLKIASKKDASTGGPMDIVILRKEGIFSYGGRIRRALNSAEDREFDKIIKEELER